MNKQTFGERTQKAVETIAEKTGIDISREALPKAPSTEIFRLFQIEAIANGLPEEMLKGQSLDEIRRASAKEIIDRVGRIKGFGEATVSKLEQELADLL